MWLYYSDFPYLLESVLEIFVFLLYHLLHLGFQIYWHDIISLYLQLYPTHSCPVGTVPFETDITKMCLFYWSLQRTKFSFYWLMLLIYYLFLFLLSCFSNFCICLLSLLLLFGIFVEKFPGHFIFI